MIAPATASTGITALTPISGASAAVSTAPVPKPPMPPTTAAATASAATAASEDASSSTALARHAARPAVGVDRDVGQRRLGHLDDLRVGGAPLGEHFHVDRHRGVADADHIGI